MRPHQLFELLAATTWRAINRASGRRILFGEDAITSVNLLVLADGQSGTYAVEDTRVSESTKGCDFELWVGSSERGWRRFAVQAKKVTPSKAIYAQLAHRSSGGTLQIDVLENYARANRAYPLYCLYSHSKKKGGWNCCLPEEQPQLGCSVTPSGVIRDTLGKRGARSFTAIHDRRETVPWRCLTRCGASPAYACSSSSVLFQDPEWPNEYDALPAQLELLVTGKADDMTDSGEMYSSNVQYRPQWVAVVDVAAREADA